MFTLVKMMRGLLIFLAVCTFTAAMVPRDRQAVHNEEEAQVTTTLATKNICAPNTPCAWSVYKPLSKIIEINIVNTYCECDKNSVCMLLEDDMSASAYVHKCRPPNENGATTES